MRNTRPITPALLVLALALALFAPVAATAQEAAPARVRLVHASADAPAVDIAVDGAVVAQGVTFGQATDYYVLAAGDHTFGLVVPGEAAPALEATLTLGAGEAYTAVAMGPADALTVNAFRDDLSPLALGKGRAVVIHAAETVDTVDVQTAEGKTLISGVGAGKASPVVELDAAAYDLVIAASSGAGEALPGSGMLYVNTGTLHTIVVLEGGSLALTAPTAPMEEPFATLRLAHVSPDAPAVDVYLNDVRAVSSLVYGAATEAIALPPGEYTVALRVAGDDAAESPMTAARLTLGADEAWTLLAMDRLAALQMVLFAEDTSTPSAGKARLTAIHAHPDAPAVTIALPDGTAVFENLAFGQQSAGVELAPGAYDLGVADAATGEALLQLTRLDLAAGRSYTAIVIPSAQGTQIVQPLVFSRPPAAPLEAPAAVEVAAETTPATPEAAQGAAQGAAQEAAPEVEPEVTPTALPTTTPVAAAAGPISGVVVTEGGYYLNVRRGPGLSYDPQPFRGLPPGAQVEVKGRNPGNDWLYIRWEGGDTPVEGWVSANFMEVTRGGARVAVAELPLAIGGEEAAPAAGEQTTTASGPASGGATFTVSDLHYSADGRQAFMIVNVTNLSLRPALASGNWYPQLNPDGGRRWVTLFKSTEGDIPVPMIDNNAPLWEFIVTLDNGRVFRAYAGCEYFEEIVGEGFEPTAQGGFTWTQTLAGGWWRCGYDYNGAPKPPNDLLPGESYSVPLNFWLVDPRAPFEPGQNFGRIVRLDFVPKAPDGTSFGVQASVTP